MSRLRILFLVLAGLFLASTARAQVTMGVGVQVGPTHQALVAWTASITGDVTSYNIYRSTVNGSGYVKIASVNVPAVAYLDTSVLAGKTYYYVFTAVDVNGESAFSTQVSGTIPTP